LVHSWGAYPLFPEFGVFQIMAQPAEIRNLLKPGLVRFYGLRPVDRMRLLLSSVDFRYHAPIAPSTGIPIEKNTASRPISGYPD
jgi:hypothetical protein